MPKVIKPEALRQEQDSFIKAFLCNGRKAKKACKSAKISESKLLRWKKDPAFLARLEDTRTAQAEAQSILMKRLDGLADAALEEILLSEGINADKTKVALKIKDVVHPELWSTEFRKAQAANLEAAPVTIILKRGPDRKSAVKTDDESSSASG